MANFSFFILPEVVGLFFFLILLPTHGSSCRWKKRNEGSCCARVLSCCFCADGGAALPVPGSSRGPFLHRLKVWTVDKLPPSCSGDACPHLPGLQRSRGGNKNAHSSPGGLIILQQQQHFTELTFLFALWDWIQVDSFVKPLPYFTKQHLEHTWILHVVGQVSLSLPEQRLNSPDKSYLIKCCRNFGNKERAEERWLCVHLFVCLGNCIHSPVTVQKANPTCEHEIARRGGSLGW